MYIIKYYLSYKVLLFSDNENANDNKVSFHYKKDYTCRFLDAKLIYIYMFSLFI